MPRSVNAMDNEQGIQRPSLNGNTTTGSLSVRHTHLSSCWRSAESFVKTCHRRGNSPRVSIFDRHILLFNFARLRKKIGRYFSPVAQFRDAVAESSAALRIFFDLLARKRSTCRQVYPASNPLRVDSGLGRLVSPQPADIRSTGTFAIWLLF